MSARDAATTSDGLLHGGPLVTGGPAPRVLADGAVAWRGGRVVAVGSADELLREHPDLPRLEARGGLILPGLVNLHQHLYSALARGLDPGAPMADFPRILERLWWRLDRALDEPCVRVSAELGAADCIRHGCTTLFDHHASPSFVGGSLDAVADVLEGAGLSAVLAYEVSDRNGAAEAAAGVDENLAFVRARAAHPRVRGVIGLHASFSVRDATLRRIADERPAHGGCHVHVAEHPVDVERTRALCGVGPVERLERFGLLDERALLAHGVHLDAGARARVAAAGATLVHNPESNANNGVGWLDLTAAAEQGVALGLGTDGMSSNMLRALRAAFLGLRAEQRDPTLGFDVLPGLLAANAAVAGRFLDEPLLGRLAPGAPADVIVIDAPPPTPLGADNLFGHLVYGASEHPVRHTVARGRVLLRDFAHTTLDPAEIAGRARELAPAMWERLRALPPDTPGLERA